ncbi:MAG TPA: vitamin K epoxide reductase family protein [Acidobacteriaceae bacterium]|nr:vitamin K epoxide reductase family protein [Acidobacteriaceae bacterium]
MSAAVSETQTAPDGLLLAAACAAAGTLIPVVAHQLGILGHLPDPPGSLFASDRITESKAAHPLGIPDGVLGAGSYAATIALVLLARTRPKVRKLLALKLVADGSLAGFNVVRQVALFEKLCSWCTGTAACTAVMVLAGRRLLTAELSLRKPSRRKPRRQRKPWR